MPKQNLKKLISLSALSLLVISSLTTYSAINTYSLVGQDGLGISPSEEKGGDVLSKGWFIENLKPGESVKRNLSISNYSSEEKTVHLAAEDRQKNTGDSFSFTNPEIKKTEVGSWVSLSKTDVTVPSQKAVMVEFTITVPKDAKSGEYAGVVAMQEVKKDSQTATGFNVVSVTGARIYVTVPGDIKLGTEFKKFEFITPKSEIYKEFLIANSFHKIQEDGFLTMDFQNTGNIFQKLKGNIEIQTPDGNITESFDRDYAPFDNVVSVPFLATKAKWKPGNYKAKFVFENTPVIKSNKGNDVKNTNSKNVVETEFVMTQEIIDQLTKDKELATKGEIKVDPKSKEKSQELVVKEANLPKTGKDEDSKPQTQENKYSQLTYGLAGMVVILLGYIGFTIYKQNRNNKKTNSKESENKLEEENSDKN